MELDAVAHGAGLAGRNIAGNIMMLQLARNFQMQKTTMMETVAVLKKVSKKKITVLEGIQDTVESDGDFF